jgi:hypothetical protein
MNLLEKPSGYKLVIIVATVRTSELLTVFVR